MAEVITQSKTVRVSVNGQVIVTPDPSGIAMDALDQVTVNTSVPDEHIMMQKTITENGTYDAPEGIAYDKIVVDVDSAELEEITIEENGTYEPEEKDGYSKVIVDVQPTEEEKEALREEGRDEQLATDKAAVEALSPINENGSYDLLGAELAIDVQPNIFITNKQLTVGSNGTVVLTPTQMEGYDASYFSKVTIVTDVTPVLENKLIQANGIYTPAAGYDGFGKVDVEVNVQPDLEDKTFTSNGVYESSKDGFGKVTVQVQGGTIQNGPTPVSYMSYYNNGYKFSLDQTEFMDLSGIVYTGNSAGFSLPRARVLKLPSIADSVQDFSLNMSVVNTGPYQPEELDTTLFN